MKNEKILALDCNFERYKDRLRENFDTKSPKSIIVADGLIKKEQVSVHMDASKCIVKYTM